MTTYAVMRYPDGGPSEYAGEARTLGDARRLAALAAGGRARTTEESLYVTARASGSRAPGCDYPPDEIGEPIEWVGNHGWAICPVG